MSITSKEIVNIQQLKFDKLNPRLPKRLQGITDEAKIIDYMLKNGNILELMKSIAETGYSEAEPFLVIQDAEDKKYVVVEGNRRNDQTKIKSKFQNPNIK